MLFFAFVYICRSVCRLHGITPKVVEEFQEFFGKFGWVNSTRRRLDFGGDPDHDVDTGIFKRNFFTVAELDNFTKFPDNQEVVDFLTKFLEGGMSIW